ncbi:DMT family transporter [Nonomuraea basaltis]|nr:DMT family transporter [Nonomuraea basaltis]
MATSSFIRLGILALLWGSSFLWIAIALRGLSPAQITLIRLALGALVLYPIIKARGLRLPAQPILWIHLAIAALFANAIPYTLFAIAEQHVSSSVAGVLNATTPLWTIFLGFIAGTDLGIGDLVIEEGVQLRRLCARVAAPAAHGLDGHPGDGGGVRTACGGFPLDALVQGPPTQPCRREGSSAEASWMRKTGWRAAMASKEASGARRDTGTWGRAPGARAR